MAKKSKGSVYKDNNNRFRLLRFKDEDDIKGVPSLTVDDMVEKTGLSKGLISKLEGQQLDTDQAPNCNAGTVKVLHDTLGVSYEYIMGETTSKTNRNKFGKDPLLSAFNDDFWDHLRDSLKGNREQRILLLRMLLKDPEEIGNVLDAMFEYLCQIHHHNKLGVDNFVIADSLGQFEYSFNRYLDRFLQEKIYPDMTVALDDQEEMRERLREHEDEIFTDLMKGFAEYTNKTD